MYAEIGSLISNVGFPVFVAVFVLLRLEPTIRRMEKAMHLQSIILARITGQDYQKIKKDFDTNGCGHGENRWW